MLKHTKWRWSWSWWSDEVVFYDLYRITQYTQDLPQTQVDETIAKAFKLYSDVIPLDFKQIYKSVSDIEILFKGGRESDFTTRTFKTSQLYWVDTKSILKHFFWPNNSASLVEFFIASVLC